MKCEYCDVEISGVGSMIPFSEDEFFVVCKPCVTKLVDRARREVAARKAHEELARQAADPTWPIPQELGVSEGG